MKNITLIILLIFPFLLKAQTFTIGNQTTMGGWAFDRFADGIQTSTGDFLFGSYTASGVSGDKLAPSRGDNDFWIIKKDASLNELWQVTIGGDSVDILSSIIETSDGGFLLAGYSNSSISGDKTAPYIGSYDYWVVKIDNLGNIVYQNTYGGSGDETLAKMIELLDGNYLLVGGSNSGVSGDKTEASKGGGDYWVLKIDLSGNVLWDKTIGGSGGDVIEDAIENSVGEIVLTGISGSGISGDKTEASYGFNDIWVVKISTTGNVLWDKTLGGAFTEQISSVIQENGYYYVICSSDSDISGTKTESSNGGADYWITKMDASGNIIWDRSIGGSNYDLPNSILVSSKKELIMGGQSLSNISGDKTENNKGAYDFWVIAMDTSGVVLWDKTIGGSGYDYMQSMIETGVNTYILLGGSESGISGDKTEASRGSNDLWVVEMTTTVSVEEITGVEISVYPNPSSEFVYLNTDKSVFYAEIKIYNSFGQMVKSMFHYELGTALTISDLAKGMYWVEIQTDSVMVTKKFLVD